LIRVLEEVKDIKDRVCRIRDALGTGLVERDLAVRLALIAGLSGEHLLLVGPPGTAKSLIACRLRHAFVNASCFERLLTRFSVPEELFSPVSIKGLEDDRYERLTDPYLPTG
jgi:MoxR-like ATPase